MKTIPHKFHHLKRIHSNRKRSRYYKMFRKAKAYRLPDLEPIDYSPLSNPNRFFKIPTARIRPIEMINQLTFIKDEFLEEIKFNPEPLRHFVIKTFGTGSCLVLFDNCDFHLPYQEALSLWLKYLDEDELQNLLHNNCDINGKPIQGTLSYPSSSYHRNT